MYNRCRSLARVLFPEPLRPTTPTVVPAGISQGNIPQDFRTIELIPEADTLKPHRPTNGRQAHLSRVEGGLRRGVDQIAQPLDGDPYLLEVLPELHRAQDWRDHSGREHLESDELPDRELAAHDEIRPGPENRQRRELLERLTQRSTDAGEVRRTERCRHVPSELYLPLPIEDWLESHRLDRLHTRDRLDQIGLILRAAIELLSQPLPQQRPHDERQPDEKRNARKRHAGQNPAVEEHHGKEDHREGEIENHVDGGAGDELAYILELPHPRHGIPHPPQLEIPQGDVQQVPEEFRPERHVDPVRRMHQEVCLQDRQNRFEDDEDEHPGGEHIEGRDALVDQHLVDDDLGEKRCRESEDLDDEGCRQDLPEDLPVLPDRGHEPEEVETPVRAIEPQARFDQNDATGPYGLELRSIHALGAGLAWISNEYPPIRIGTQQNDELAGLELRDDRQRAQRQGLPARPRRLRLEPQLLGSQKNLRVGDRRGRIQSERPGELCGVCRPLMSAGDYTEANDPRGGWQRPNSLAITREGWRRTYALFGAGRARRLRGDSMLEFVLVVILMTGFRTGVHRRLPWVLSRVDSIGPIGEKQQSRGQSHTQSITYRLRPVLLHQPRNTLQVLRRIDIWSRPFGGVRHSDQETVLQRPKLLQPLCLLQHGRLERCETAQCTDPVGVDPDMTSRTGKHALTRESRRSAVAIPGNRRTSEIKRPTLRVGDHLHGIGIEELLE